MIKPETLDNSETTSLEGRLKECDDRIKIFVKEVGAKCHKFNIDYTMIFGVMFPKRFGIEIEFEDGVKFGQSDNNFKDCFDKVVEHVCYRKGKTNPYKQLPDCIPDEKIDELLIDLMKEVNHENPYPTSFTHQGINKLMAYRLLVRNHLYNWSNCKIKNPYEKHAEPSLLDNWMVNWIKYPNEKPTEYGHYWVYRKGCDKLHKEVWNNTGWAYNNNDITHWTVIQKPID